MNKKGVLDMAKIPGKCPQCGKETLESYKEIISVKGLKYDFDGIRCTNCAYSTNNKK
jgi:uncharacterized Zn finger protein